MVIKNLKEAWTGGGRGVKLTLETAGGPLSCPICILVIVESCQSLAFSWDPSCWTYIFCLLPLTIFVESLNLTLPFLFIYLFFIVRGPGRRDPGAAFGRGDWPALDCGACYGRAELTIKKHRCAQFYFLFSVCVVSVVSMKRRPGYEWRKATEAVDARSRRNRLAPGQMHVCGVSFPTTAVVHLFFLVWSRATGGLFLRRRWLYYYNIYG